MWLMAGGSCSRRRDTSMKSLRSALGGAEAAIGDGLGCVSRSVRFFVLSVQNSEDGADPSLTVSVGP